MSDSFITRVRDALAQLPPTERRLADFMLDFPGNLSSYSASEIAQLTGVSNASVTRLVQRLGYESYEEARRHARLQGGTGSPLFTAPASVSGTATAMALQLQQAHENLAATLVNIPQTLIDTVARALLDARQVFFLGYRQNRNFAACLRWQLTQVLAVPPQAIPGPGETLAEYGGSLTEQDMLVVFALRRSVPLVERFAAQAQRAGARVLCITDHASEALPADWLLRCHTQAPGPLDNHMALTMLCHLIASQTMHFAGAAGRRRMGAIETWHDRLEEL